MDHIRKTSLVVKDNRLIESSYRLDLCEQRVLLMAIIQARSNNMHITSEEWLEVKALDYSAVYDVDISTAYKHLKAAADGLLTRQIVLSGINQITQKAAILKTHWVTHAMYVPSDSTILLRLSDIVIPYITNLESHFTSYQLKEISKMTSTYAIRMYELLLQYQIIGKRTIDIHELKRLLGADEKSYDRLDNLKRKVIDIAIAQINTSSDLQVDYVQIKNGKSVVAFQFNIAHKPESALAQTKLHPQHTTQYVFSLAEKVMLRDLQQHHPTLSEGQILQQVKSTQKSIFEVLNELRREAKG